MLLWERSIFSELFRLKNSPQINSLKIYIVFDKKKTPYTENLMFNNINN